MARPLLLAASNTKQMPEPRTLAEALLAKARIGSPPLTNRPVAPSQQSTITRWLNAYRQGDPSCPDASPKVSINGEERCSSSTGLFSL